MKPFEPLPENCPPKEAGEPKGNPLFRLIAGKEPVDEDFHSYFKLRGRVPKGADACIARAISLFNSRKQAKDLKKLPRFKDMSIYTLKLKEEDGKIMPTLRPGHISWWRSETFSITTNSNPNPDEPQD